MMKTVLLFVAMFFATSAFAQNIQPLQIPLRQADAIGGAEFMQSLIPMTLAAREQAIFNQAAAGNIPDAFRQMTRIETTLRDVNGVNRTVVLEVMPDFLAIGSDDDFYRIPLLPMTAQRIADAFGAILPTRRLSNLAWQYAEVRMVPQPIAWHNDNVTVPVFITHNQMIETQRATFGKPLHTLIAGHKKDIVITNQIFTHPQGLNRVWIFGWHRLDGTPIQNLNGSHSINYVDYSHGVRLINQQMMIDGVTRNVRDVLRDPVMYRLISDETGIMRITEYGGEVYPPPSVDLTLVLGKTPTAPFEPLLTSPYTINIGEEVHLGIRIGGNAGWENRLDFTLTSSHPNVAAIAATGTVTALASGITTLRAAGNSGGAEGTIILRVIDPDRPDNFPAPENNENIIVPDFFEFSHHKTLNASWLNESNIRRAIHRNGKLYVLTRAPNPGIFIADASTLEIIREMDLTGVSGGLNGVYLSDIAFTADNKLLASNLAVITSTTTSAGNFLNSRFKVYIWDNDDAQPRVFYELYRNADAVVGSHEAMLGNLGNGFWFHGRLGETIAVSGTSRDAVIYMPAFSADANTGAGETFRMVAHVVRDGALVQTCYRMRTGGTSPDAGGNPFDAPNNFGGTGFQLHVSPLADDRIILTSQAHAPTEFHWNWSEHRRSALHLTAAFATNFNTGTRIMGANYFRFADRIFMVAPVKTITLAPVYVNLRLFDITDGLNNAVEVFDVRVETSPVSRSVAAFSVVHNDYIALYSLTLPRGFARFTANFEREGDIYKPKHQQEVRVFPNPVQNILNIDADFEITTIRLIDLTGRIIMNIPANQHFVNLSDIPAGNHILFVNDVPVRIVKQ